MKKFLLLATVASLWVSLLGCSADLRITSLDETLSPQTTQSQGKVSFQWNSTDGTTVIQARRFRKGSGVVRLTTVPTSGPSRRPLTCVGNIIFLASEPANDVVLGHSKLSGFCARRIGLTNDPALQWWRFTLVWKQRDPANVESDFGVALFREGESSSFKEFFPSL